MNNRGLILAYLAKGAISAYRIVKFGAGNGEILQSAAATDKHIGVTTDVPNPAADGDDVDVVRSGVTPVVYGGNVTRGDLLSADANGKAVTVAPEPAIASVAITGITQANPGVVTAASHGLVTGDRVGITGVGGMVEVNQNVYVATVIDANSFSIGVNSTGFTAYTAGGALMRLGSAATPIRTIGIAEISGALDDIGSVFISPGLVQGA